MRANKPVVPRHHSLWRHYWELLLFKLYGDIKVEMEITYLGFLWWLIEPAFFLGIYFVVFGYVIQNNIPHFVEFLFIGVVVWRWFGPGMIRGSRAIMQHKNIIQEIYVSKVLFPICEVGNGAIKFLLVFVVVLLVLMLLHHDPTWLWLTIFPNLLVQIVLICGLSFCFASMTPFIPDLPLVIQTLMMAMMMLSGVFYDISKAPAQFAFLLQLNPIADVITNYRLPLIYDTQPNWGWMLYGLVFGAVLNGIGIAIIRKNERVYPKV